MRHIFFGWLCITHLLMLQNLLLSAFRNLKRAKFFSALNILGLAVGMAVFLLIAQYVQFEHSYESFILNKKDIYRVSLTTYRNNQLILATAQNYSATGPAIKDEVPGVVSYARLFYAGYRNNVVITNENSKPQPISFKQRRLFSADSSFLPMMGYEMASGNAATALADPKSVVISEQYARLYFGKQDPIGATLHLQDDDLNDELVMVTGVFKDLPANTHLKFDILFSNKLFDIRDSWRRESMHTYVQLQPGVDPKTVAAKLPALINKYKPELSTKGEKQVLGLQPLSDIHLHSNLAEEPGTNGDAGIVSFISIIGLFVLAIAWINYINLSTARAINRAKEVGIRKVIGAYRHQLVQQFLMEAALVNLLSLLIAYGLVFIALPAFNSISGLSLTNSYLTQPWYLYLLLILWVAGSFLSGFYPALVLSSYKPVTILKNKFRSSLGGIVLRKGLVVTQFVASVALIAGTFIVYSQLSYMLNRDIGMDITQVVSLERPSFIPGKRQDINNTIDAFRNELKKIPSIESATNSLTIPGKQREYKSTLKNEGARDSIIVRVNSMDYSFIDVFKMKLIAGRNFSPPVLPGKDSSLIITASAAHMLGYTNPQDAIGKIVTMTDNRSQVRLIIGVVNDYHQLSLNRPLEPGAFYCSPNGGGYFLLRIRTDNLPQTLSQVKQVWTTAFPGNPFEYFFLDDYFNRQYANVQQFAKLFTVFAFFAILISCLGLLGLSAFTASQRIKEIGIRKVLGASVTNITSMLSKDFLKLVFVSVIIATPVIWITMSKWLEGFAYRINMSWWIFAGAGLIALLIALITISFQAIKAAMANPVKSLRTE